MCSYPDAADDAVEGAAVGERDEVGDDDLEGGEGRVSRLMGHDAGSERGLLTSDMIRIPPPPTPWTERPAIAMAIDWAEPVTAEPAMKKRREAFMMHRRPKMAASPPVHGINAVEAST